jgi:hypothetical protein
MKEGLLKFWLKQKDYTKMSVSTIKSILKTCSIEYERLNESRLGDSLTDQMQVVEALRKPEAYDEEV